MMIIKSMIKIVAVMIMMIKSTIKNAALLQEMKKELHI